MATLPQATTELNEATGNALAGGAGYLVVIGCVSQSADYVPRLIAGTQALLTQYAYAPAVDYCALHFDEANTPVIFVGVPIVTPGTIGSQDTTGNTGTSYPTVSATTASGPLEAVRGQISVQQGGIVGASQIVLLVSLDGGISVQPVRLGANASVNLPYVNLTLNFSPGVLNQGDVVLTFNTTAPMWGSTALESAFTALADQQQIARSALVVGNLPSSTFAGYVQTEADNYASEDERFIYCRASLPAYGPLAKKSKTVCNVSTYTSLTAASSGHTITRVGGSFLTDGFQVGDVVTIAGSVSNNGTLGPITGLSATVATFASGVANETLPTEGVTMTGSESLSFASGDTITRGVGSWLNDGFAVGQTIVITGSTSNNVTAVITGVTATVLTASASAFTAEIDSSAAVSIVETNTLANAIASASASFAGSGDKRVDLSFGDGIKQSQITGYSMRRPAAWAASLREYQHDVQIPCWRKADGACAGWSLTDANGNRTEYDERTIGGALAARFTCFRSYGNGPVGAFIALALTRDADGALLSRTHNMSVANLAQTVVQIATENAIGAVLQLNADGTGTKASLSQLAQAVNTQLQLNLLQDFDEGPRASGAVWTPSTTDILNVAGATLHGVLALNLNGTIEKIDTSINVS